MWDLYENVWYNKLILYPGNSGGKYKLFSGKFLQLFTNLWARFNENEAGWKTIMNTYEMILTQNGEQY